MGEIITFYSYKGGVGRTMALANVGVLLSKWEYKVLIVDWDVEAPGLEFFFKDYLDLNTVEQTEGIIDLLINAFDNALQPQDLLKWQNSLLTIELPDNKEPLHLLTAGKKAKTILVR